MNQIILIGEVNKLEENDKGLTMTIKTKDFKKDNKLVNVWIEPGYKKDMVEVLEKKPLVAVKAGLKITKLKVEFVAEKMSVLKLTEEDEDGSKESKDSATANETQAVDEE